MVSPPNGKTKLVEALTGIATVLLFAGVSLYIVMHNKNMIIKFVEINMLFGLACISIVGGEKRYPNTKMISKTNQGEFLIDPREARIGVRNIFFGILITIDLIWYYGSVNFFELIASMVLLMMIWFSTGVIFDFITTNKCKQGLKFVYFNCKLKNKKLFRIITDGLIPVVALIVFYVFVFYLPKNILND